MTIEEYLVWDAEREIDGRFELHRGQVVKANAERISHAFVKGNIRNAFHNAIRARGLPCHALPDGMAVPVGDDTVFEPDAQVYCGERLAPDTVLIRHPVIVVEVLSPFTRRTDLGIKMVRYFLNESIQHYLIVVIEDRKIIHHQRASDVDIRTRIDAGGDIVLDPPGLVLAVADVFGDI